jgi:hypothetical protein
MAHGADEEEPRANLADEAVEAEPRGKWPDKAELERMRRDALSRVPERRPILWYVGLGIAGLVVYSWLSVWYSDYDSKRIDPVVTSAVLAHAAKGTRIPVQLFWGTRVVVIKSAYPEFPGERTGAMGPEPPDTIVAMDVVDPKTGKIDARYSHGFYTVIEGVAITIR